MKLDKRNFPLFLYIAISLVLIWSGSGWVIYEMEKVFTDENRSVFNSRSSQFILLHGVSMILIGIYIMVKNIIYKDTIIY